MLENKPDSAHCMTEIGTTKSRHANRIAWMKAFEESISRGKAAATAGKGKPADEVFDRLIAKYQAMADAKEGSRS